MINKNGVWFVTLFSLILVLSIYYITMPTELLISNDMDKAIPTVKVEESDILFALRVSSDEEINEEIDVLKEIISNSESTIEEKNNAFERIKELNGTRSEEETLEAEIEKEHNLKSFIKIEDNNTINVTVKNAEHNQELANQIMRTIQKNYNEKKYISVKFQK